VAVANGGTGATTLATNNVLLGNGTSAPLTVAPGASGNVLMSNGTTWASATPTTNWAAPGAIGATTPNSAAFTTLTASGNIGIGTTAPVATVHASLAGGASLGLSNSSGTTDAKNWFLGPNSSGNLIGWAANDANNASQQWLNVNRSGYNISSVTFPSGNVEIGSRAPAYLSF
jgi:hypothetical protein